MNNSVSYKSKYLNREIGRHCPLDIVEIDADAGTIWQEIDNFDNWETWNPLYVESKGSFYEGNAIQFSVALPGMKPQRGKAEVIRVQPGEFVQYQIKSMGGLVRGTRFVEIQQITPTSCLVANGEIMGGMLGPLLFRAVGERIRQGLAAMNRALKTRLENR